MLLVGCHEICLAFRHYSQFHQSIYDSAHRVPHPFGAAYGCPTVPDKLVDPSDRVQIPPTFFRRLLMTNG